MMSLAADGQSVRTTGALPPVELRPSISNILRWLNDVTSAPMQCAEAFDPLGIDISRHMRQLHRKGWGLEVRQAGTKDFE